MSVTRWLTDIAHQHQAAAAQGEIAPAGGGVAAIVLQPPRLGPPPLGEAGGQVAAHQTQPVAIDANLVLRIDGGDRVLAVLDGGLSADSTNRSLTPAGSVLPIACCRSIWISRCRPLWVNSTAVRRRRLAAPAGELFGGGQKALAAGLQLHDQVLIDDDVGDGVGVRPVRQRRDPIQQVSGEGDHLAAPLGVIALGAGWAAPARRCRRGRHTGSPTARWRRSGRSGRWRPAPPVAARPAWRSPDRRWWWVMWNRSGSGTR